MREVPLRRSCPNSEKRKIVETPQQPAAFFAAYLGDSLGAAFFAGLPEIEATNQQRYPQLLWEITSADEIVPILLLGLECSDKKKNLKVLPDRQPS